jgi:prepilin-type N-terminal cleavage/methylation domain-containing protein
MRKAFTLIEVVVALGILAVILSFAGVIFRVSIDSQRMAMANAEIMQKLRVITEQLDADFRGLCTDGEILVFWRAAQEPNRPPASFERYDTIMFFASGDFHTYGPSPQRSNIARICYTLANVPSGGAEPNRPPTQRTRKRMLARTQHILLPPTTTANVTDPLGMSGFSDAQWRDWNSRGQSDAISMQGWMLIGNAVKADIISIIGDIEVNIGITSTRYKNAGGVLLDRTQPGAMHAMLCDGVGQFKVEGWSIDPDDPTEQRRRWMPQVDPNENGDLTDDSDFILDGANLHPRNVPGLRYPDGPVTIRNSERGSLRGEPLSMIPGLGQALKFTFTLYDSRGLIPNGRTFTHIVPLAD